MTPNPRSYLRAELPIITCLWWLSPRELRWTLKQLLRYTSSTFGFSLVLIKRATFFFSLIYCLCVLHFTLFKKVLSSDQVQKRRDDIITIISMITTTNNWYCGFKSFFFKEFSPLWDMVLQQFFFFLKLGLRMELIKVFLRLNYKYRQALKIGVCVCVCVMSFPLPTWFLTEVSNTLEVFK